MALARLGAWIRKGRLLFTRDRYRRELAEEMAFHQNESQRAHEAAGMSAQQARRTARVQFGNAQRLREESQREAAFRWESMGQDVRYAVRQMRRAPGFTLAVVLTLALGIGATTAIFTVVNAVLLRPLPYPSAEKILSVEDQRLAGSSSGGMVGVPRFFDIKARNHTLDSVAFFYFEHPTLAIAGDLPEEVDGVGASGEFWRVFGAHAMLGRTFDESDDKPKAAEVAVLSYGAWKNLFAGRADVIGSVVTIDKLPTTIIGVMPRAFDYPSGNAIWRPTHFDAADWSKYRGDGVRFARVFARLKANVTATAARSELATIGGQLRAEHPESDGPWQFVVKGLRDYQYGRQRPALLTLQAASALLLLIACVNAANLLLSRATARRHEVAMRQALGASRRRILQQHLIESLLRTMLGGGAGLAFAFALLRIVGHRLPGALQEAPLSAFQGSVIWFAFGVSMVTGLVFGLLPALSQRGGMHLDWKHGDTRSGDRTGARLRDGFIALQVGLSLVLLVGASLLAQSLWKLTRTPLGFEPDHVLSFQIKLPWRADPVKVNRFYDEVQRRMEQLPGVTAVGQVSALPTEGYNFQQNYDADWLPATSHQDAVRAEIRAMAGNYLQAMSIPLLAGRALHDGDKAVLVNQEFVRAYLHGLSPLGRQLRFDKDKSVMIAGVIGNVRGTTGALAEQVQPEIYFEADGAQGRSLVLRTQWPSDKMDALIYSVRQQVHEVDPQQAVGNARTLDAMLDIAVAQPRLNMALVASFAGIALLLASLGIYGVVAYSVAQRRQEIGVRMALGARRGQISLLFLQRALAAALVGLAGGVGAALMLTRLLRGELYGVEPDSPAAFAVAALLLMLPIFAASLRPALRAASLNPVDALRVE